MGWRDASRAVVIIASLGLVSSYALTWDLWHGRTSPPNLPAIGALSSAPFGLVLLLAAAVATLAPRVGAAVHGTVLLLAMLGDQVRLQPEFISLAILLAAGAWPPKSLEIGRWHVITMWAWAGVHKVLSKGWPLGGAAFMADAAGVGELRTFVAVAVPAAEIALAMLALWPTAWRVLRIAAPVFHVGVVLVLAAVDWNTAVWPWNLALAASAPFLFQNPARGAPESRRIWTRSPAVLAAVIAFAVVPAGFYAGVVDAYPSHNLYSSNTAEAFVCTRSITRSCVPAPFFSTWDDLNVPLPPEDRLFVAWFHKICRPGETLRIEGIWTRLADRATSHVTCPGQAAASSL